MIFDNGKYYYFATGDLLASRSSTNLACLVGWAGRIQRSFLVDPERGAGLHGHLAVGHPM